MKDACLDCSVAFSRAPDRQLRTTPPVPELRDLTRYRKALVNEKSAEVSRPVHSNLHADDEETDGEAASLGDHYGHRWGNGRTSDEGGGVMEGRHREALIGSCSSLNHVLHCSGGSDTCALL